MLAKVAAHLKTKGTYSAITQVRLTGINRTTDEFRLPEEILTTPCVTNSIVTWQQAGYRPALLLHAWDLITTSFATHFPDKLFSLPIIPVDTGTGAYPFPEIDDNGCVYSPPVDPGDFTGCANSGGVPDQNFPLAAMASQKFPGRLVFQFDKARQLHGHRVRADVRADDGVSDKQLLRTAGRRGRMFWWVQRSR